MEETWCALALAVLSPRYITPESAFHYLDEGRLPAPSRGRGSIPTNFLTSRDNEDMVRLRAEQNLTYKDIGSLYGLSMDAVRRRILRNIKKAALR